MTPEAVGLVVVHDQRIRMKLARNPKGQLFAGNATVIHDGRITKRSPGHRKRDHTALVVDDFMAAQNRDRISARVGADFDADDTVVTA